MRGNDFVGAHTAYLSGKMKIVAAAVKKNDQNTFNSELRDISQVAQTNLVLSQNPSKCNLCLENNEISGGHK